MKILNLERNDFGQVIATVLNAGRNLTISARMVTDLPKLVAKACYFTTPEDVRIDLQLNYPDFK